MAESSYFSVGSGFLVADSMSQPFQNAPGSMRAVFSFDPADTAGVSVTTLRFEARVLASETVQFNYGFEAGVDADGRAMRIGLMENGVALSTSQFVTLDTSIWRSYELVSDYESNTFEVFVDGSLIGSSSLSSSSLDQVGVGDGTGNAHVQFRDLTATIPAPASASIGIAGLVLTRRRRSRGTTSR